MEKSAPNGHYQDNEIDLYDLWIVLKKRKITILLTILIFAGLAVAYTVVAPKVYRISNTLVLNQYDEIITKGEVISAVKELDELLTLNKERAAQALGLHVNVLDEIRNIKAAEVKGVDVVRVDIQTRGKTAGIALMEALPGYIQSKSNISGKLKMKKALMEKNRDDLKAIIDNPTRDLKLSPNTVVYVPSLDLYQLREKYNGLSMMIEKMEQGRFVTLSSRTVPPAKEYEPKKSVIVLLGLFMGGFIGFFLAFIMEWSSNASRARGLK